MFWISKTMKVSVTLLLFGLLILFLWAYLMKFTPETLEIYIYTVRQKLSTTWLVSIISFLIMNLFQIKKKYIDKNIGWCLTFVGVYIYMYTFYYCNKESKYTSSLKSDLSLALVLWYVAGHMWMILCTSQWR